MGSENPASDDFSLIYIVCFVCVLAILAFLIYKLYNRVVELSKDIDNIKNSVEKDKRGMPKIEEIEENSETDIDIEIDPNSDAELAPVINKIKNDPVSKNLDIIDEDEDN
jgi:predicted Holliday junction resolvase-like endonuclease